MPSASTLYDFCFGIDITPRKPIWTWGWVMGPGATTVLGNGVPLTCGYDICQSPLGGTGFVIPGPRAVFANGRTVATQFDTHVGTYQGWILSTKTPNIQVTP